nr:hypothetical protein [Tanacetum cinerariifolium]
ERMTDAIDAEITMVNDADKEMFDVDDLGVSIASAATTVSVATITTATITTVGDITLAQALEEIKSTKPKEKGIDIQELETAFKLQAVFNEEERLARENVEKVEEDNIALIETWDDILAKIDDDHQLAERMQAQEHEELSITEKDT